MPTIKVEPATDNPMKPKDIEYEIDENGCWNVTSHHWQSDGYPRISRANQIIKMSRFTWTEFIGGIPPGMLILHTCDNARCINPDHLYLGTHKDNSHDAIERNRLHPNPPKGSQSPKSKLTERQVGEILESDEDHEILAKKYGVCFQTISLIRLGKTWKHVQGKRGERKRGTNPSKGFKRYRAKFTEDDIRFIRENRGTLTLKELAKIFSCTFQAISKIQTGKNWKHVATCRINEFSNCFDWKNADTPEILEHYFPVKSLIKELGQE